VAKTYRYFDVTLPLGKDIPCLPIGTPENPAVPIPVVERFQDVEKGDRVTQSRIAMISHDGTHIDAPLHFIPGGTTIDAMPYDTTIGPCRVLEIKDEKFVKVEELEPYKIKAGERILFKTRNSPGVYDVWWYTGPFVTVSPEAARYLAERKIRLVGIDYLTIAGNDPPENIGTVHEAFLRNGIFIIEGLNLAGIEPGDYEIICLPLRLAKGDAGPCRVLLRK
jgi:arylformamidase